MIYRYILYFLVLFSASAEVVSARDFLSVGRHGAVSTGHELATRAALEMLARGGNAVDAAVAAGFMLAVVEPSNSGIGGDGFAVLKRADGKYEAWDASIRRPAAGLGRSAIGIPTEPALLLRLLEKHGTMPAADVLAPAISAARDGFPVSSYLERRIDEKIQYFHDAEAIATFAPSGRPLRAGETLKQPLLAETLVRLAANNPAELYSGALSSILIADLSSRKSSYTAHDISSYEPRISRPIAVSVGSYTLIGPPPPCASIAVMTGIREIFEQERASGTRISLDKRLLLLEHLLRTMTNSLANSIRSPRRFLQDAGGVPAPVAPEAGTSQAASAAETSGETTHLVTWDASGMIVSMTLTLGTHFGTCDYSPLGFFYNSELANFGSSYFRYPRAYPNDAGPISTKSPLIILHGSKPIIAIGGAGAGRIISNLVLIIDALLHGEKTLYEAVMAPRFHISNHRLLQIEWSPENQALSSSSSFVPPTVKPAGSDFFGLVSAVGIASSGFIAVGDYRRDGSAGAIRTAPQPLWETTDVRLERHE